MSADIKKMRVLINPKSGLTDPVSSVPAAVEKEWQRRRYDITYQFSNSAEDGRAKTQRAIKDGVDTVLVVGGDGMVNSIGCELIGTEVALGVIPTGSGNGFARHFNIPLDPVKAVRALAHGTTRMIDVGTANGRPFFVTCGMAWDAALVRSFEKSPIRGILPYVFSGAYEYLTYEPQPVEYTLDGGVVKRCLDPIVFTIANLTQYGGGAQIAPQARADDGHLELIVIQEKDMPNLLINITRLFDGSINRLPSVTTKKFKVLKVYRMRAAPMQLDGELVDSGPNVDVEVLPRALKILVP